jgi:hypothetical protein
MVAASLVLHDVVNGITRAAMIEDFGTWYVIAIVISALGPFPLIAYMARTRSRASDVAQ